MEKPIRFTDHAWKKFADLEALGFIVTEAQVVDTVLRPESIDASEHPPTAQKVISEKHVLRVVFIEDGEGILIVTFYPGRRKRYEDENAL